MKTAWTLISGVILMIVMYFYFIGVCLYAIVAFPVRKLANYIRHTMALNQQQALS